MEQLALRQSNYLILKGFFHVEHRLCRRETLTHTVRLYPMRELDENACSPYSVILTSLLNTFAGY